MNDNYIHLIQKQNINRHVEVYIAQNKLLLYGK